MFPVWPSHGGRRVSPTSPGSRWICEWFQADGAARSVAHIAGTGLKLTSGTVGIRSLLPPKRPQADAFPAAGCGRREHQSRSFTVRHAII